ncbi:MAG: cysteine desulfurase [Dehalococcoidia bacterium]|nr:cysteine desulfurase [Dehalococcoidia bacterium]
MDIARIRDDFPILATQVHGKPLIYLDNAATTQKPRAVIEAIQRYYTEENSNIHRGVHHLSEVATRKYESARGLVRQFIGAHTTREIIFTRGTTEGLNLVAASYGRANISKGDEIIVSAMEHHSNIVPWQMLCQEKGARLRVIPINDRGELLMDEFEKLLSPRTKLVSIVHISNSLGTINPVRRIIELAHAVGAVVLLDAAQSVAHTPIDVQSLDCDFLAFSGHKLFGPTGIGVLYGKQALLEAMPPYQGGGDMISSVTFEHTTYNHLPHKFEAGTPHIEGVIGLGAAIAYVQSVGLHAIAAHEQRLLQYGTTLLAELPKVRMIGTAREKAGILSFVVEGVHPHDVGTILDTEGIAIRAGHHCTMPVMDRFGLPATARASLSLYNTAADLDALVRGLHKVAEVLR